MEILTKIMDFISNNQLVITMVIGCATFLINKLINYMATRNDSIDIWDKVQPYSASLNKIVFDGIEMIAKKNPMSGAAKGATYILKLKEFDKLWEKDKVDAIRKLFAWYEDAKGKGEQAEQLSENSVAVEHS